MVMTTTFVVRPPALRVLLAKSKKEREDCGGAVSDLVDDAMADGDERREAGVR